MSKEHIRYRIYFTNPHRHFISFEAIFPVPSGKSIRLQMPSWRPGRYELGLFARNIRTWKATDIEGSPLRVQKFSRDGWTVEAEGRKEVRIVYEYYAADLNAGSTFLDSEQLYINPVNCMMYNPDEQDLPYQLILELPEVYEIATGMHKTGRHELRANNFDELADCPLIASAALRHFHFTCRGVKFNLWMQGEHRFDEDLLLRQFEAFTAVQIDAFGKFPVTEYHFLFQFTPYFVRHGVEHRNSTVIAMGPVADFLNENWYERMLGISSHELYHTWNVKAIRPIEMSPYQFDRENYSTLGYVAEGVTTYFGDVMMRRGDVISDASLLDIFSRHLDEHYDNPGRFNLSVADSSVDTWLDGYVVGIPGRKVSIYNEGCLIAWICDVRIREATGNQRSLDTAMRLLYERFETPHKGYTGADYKAILEEVAGVSFDDVFNDLVHGTSDYSPYLEKTTNLLGIQWRRERSSKWSEWALGLSVDESGSRISVTSVMPGSPADAAGLWNDDEILTVNGTAPYRNIQHLLRMQSGRECVLQVLRKYKLIELSLRDDGQVWKFKNILTLSESASEAQKEMYRKWSRG